VEAAGHALAVLHTCEQVPPVQDTPLAVRVSAMHSAERQPASAPQPSPRVAGEGVLSGSCAAQATASPSKSELETSALRSVGLINIFIVLPVTLLLEASR